MKINKTIALSASVCALALTGLSANVNAATTTTKTATTQAYQPKADQVTINYNANFGIAVWSTPNGHTTGKFLPGQSKVRVAGSQVVNGHTWYLLANNSGWIDGAYVKTGDNAATTTKAETTKTTNNTKAEATNKQETKDPKQGYTIYKNEIVKVESNGAHVYSAPNTSAKTSRVLPKNSNWKSFYRIDNGYLWYNLGGNQWVLATELTPSADKPATKKENSNSAKKKNTKTETTKQQSKDPNQGYTLNINQVIKVESNGAHVYSSPTSTAKTNRVLPTGSRWKAFKKVNNGYLWYNLGGNQWVLATELTPSADKPAKKTEPVLDYDVVMHGTVKVTNPKGAVVYSKPEVKTKRVLPVNSNWKVFSELHNGLKWFNLGGNQWVNADDVTSNATADNIKDTKPAAKKETTKTTTPVKSMNVTGTARINYKPGYGIRVWAQPGSQPLNKTLKHGTNWKFFKTANALGRTWYNLGGNQWIDGQYLTINGISAPKKVNNTNKTEKLLYSYGSVRYVSGYGIAIWTAPNGHTTGKYMMNNDFVNVDEITSDNKWIKVYNPLNGKEGWVMGKYVKPVFFDNQR